MESFESKIGEIFDFNLSEEIQKDNIITESIVEKAKEMARKAVSFGLEKVIPPKILSFAQGLFAAAKQGPEAVAEFLESEDPAKVEALASSAMSSAPEMIGAAVQEETQKSGKTIEEGGVELAGRLAAQSADVQDAIATGANIAGGAMQWMLVVMGIASAYGLYRVIRAGLEIYTKTKKFKSRSRHRR